jgi:PAS domain S-box-containing protein
MQEEGTPASPAGPLAGERLVLTSAAARYALALASVGAAFALRVAFSAVLSPPFILFYPAVMLAAVLGGPGPGLLATGTAAALAAGWVLPSARPAPADGQEAVSLVAFCAMGAFMSAVAALYRRARDRVGRYEKEAARTAREVALASREELEVTRDAARVGQAQLEAVFQAMGDGVVVFDVSGNAVLVNEAEARINGFAGADEMKRSMAYFARVYELSRLDGSVLPVEEWPASRVLRGESVVDCELRGRRLDTGREWVFSFSGEPVRDGRGELVLAVVITRDVTERKRAEQVRRDAEELETQNRRIREANRLKSEFLANMSHELRTPLNAILGFGELLGDGAVPPDSPQHREFLGHIVKSGRHLLELINDVLDLAKVEAGRLEFRPEPVDLRLVIAEVMSVTRAIAEGKGLRTSARVDPEVGQGISLDPARLKQILYNFVSNAIKFTPAGGSVAVRALPEGESRLRLEVEDTGPGIAPQDIGRLFVEFQQLDGGVARQHPGTGLGLALTRRLAEAQGGSVGVRSAPGQGSVFHAILPRRAAARAAPLPPPRRPAAAPGAPAVLVIEDDARDRARLVESLGEAGYAVESARTGSEAVALCRSRRFDAITLDLLLPDMAGQEVLRRVRADGPNADVPVVVVTVVAEPGAVAGFAVHDFLRKPLEPRALLSSLARAGVRPGQGGSVMVVDDDESSLKLMAAALTQLGFRASCAQDGEEALRATREAPPAAVVLDLLMPRMDGFQFLDRLRSSPATHRTPVLIWTVKDLSPEEQARLSRSAQAIVRKGHGTIPALLDDLRRFLPAR